MSYTTQMDAARQGIITPEMKKHIFGVQPITHRLLLYSTVQYFSLSYSYDLFFIIENMTDTKIAFPQNLANYF